MRLIFDKEFLEELSHRVTTDRATATKVMKLLEDIRRHPFEGLGKPEPLKPMGGNTWSRRITQEHRLVYQVDGDTVMLLQCRYHY